MGWMGGAMGGWEGGVAEGLILSIKSQREHQTGSGSVTFQNRTTQSGDQTDYPCVHLVI